MSSTFGRFLRATTFGESHGPGLGGVVDGMPPGIPLAREHLQRELDRRRPGQSAVTTQRQEGDQVELLSGVFEGLTTGTPIAFLVRNQDARPEDYEALREVFRPGHADYTYFVKYGHRDHRGGGRASGRETLCRVAAGAIARRLLAPLGVEIFAATVRIGDIEARERDYPEAERNPVRAPDAAAAAAMAELLLRLRDAGDSVGGVVEVVARNVPAGLGDPVFDKLDAVLAMAMMSIGTIKGVEIGDGFAATRLRGSQAHDAMDATGFLSNHAGGILGGISTGQDILMRLAIKPTSSLRVPQQSLNIRGEPVAVATEGRHDPCVCPRVVPVAEAMMALTLADAWLAQKAVRALG
ncbi:MAG TPA: chorismate synthase [Candidatus Saccharimonadales bacterium]|nr:chorismate synthase [Candidatus Saccharimonadales bacterium]